MSEQGKKKVADWSVGALRIVTTAMLALLAWLGQQMNGELRSLGRELTGLKIEMAEAGYHRREIEGLRTAFGDHETRLRELERMRGRE